MTHDEVLVAWLESGSLDREETADLETCASCQAVLAELDVTRDSLAEAFVWEQPDPGLEDAVVASITAAAGAPDRPVVVPDVTDTGPTPGSVPAPEAGAPVADLAARRNDPSRRGKLLSRVAVAVAAAACIVAVLAIATRPAGDDLAGPDMSSGVTIDVKGTELAPGISGRVQMLEEPSGVRIHLDAPGLPRRDGGDFYQAWLRGPDGNLVPIGTFHTADDVWLWAGVPYTEFPTFTVTEETDDGNQASSGRRVLAGTLPGATPATGAPTTAPAPSTTAG